jgi:quercetin dioxygenase-like cupin family protein
LSQRLLKETKPVFPMLSKLAIKLFVILLLPIFSVAHSQDSKKEGEKVTELLKESLSDMPGKNVMLITVDYLPGQATEPHMHPGSVIAYVLEGSFISQLEGQEPIEYHQGQCWYESPYHGHVIAKNASKELPAKLLVWLLIGDQEPVKLPFTPAKMK